MAPLFMSPDCLSDFGFCFVVEQHISASMGADMAAGEDQRPCVHLDRHIT